MQARSSPRGVRDLRGIQIMVSNWCQTLPDNPDLPDGWSDKWRLECAQNGCQQASRMLVQWQNKIKKDEPRVVNDYTWESEFIVVLIYVNYNGDTRLFKSNSFGYFYYNQITTWTKLFSWLSYLSSAFLNKKVNKGRTDQMFWRILLKQLRSEQQLQELQQQ